MRSSRGRRLLSCHAALLVVTLSLGGPHIASAQRHPSPPAPGAWQALLDDSLSRWEVWTGVPDPSVTALPRGYVRTAAAPPPIGLGDPMRLFTVARDAAGRHVLRISGEVYGGLTTRASHADFHLTLEVQWGSKKWPPRATDKRDSGLLYHCQGAHGAFWNVWKRCLEFQIQEGDVGDLHQLAGPRSLVRREGTAWSPAGVPDATSNPVTRRANHESAPGRWTRLDLYVVGDRAVHVVNGHVVLAVDGARDADGSALTSGQLQLQSEGAEVRMRDIRMRPLARLPDAIARAAGWAPSVRQRER